MATGFFLAEGVDLPFHVIDAAIEWAKQHDARLTGIFIYSDEHRGESYGFPSDIEQAVTLVSENEGERRLDKLVGRNMEYARKQCEAAGIEAEMISIENADKHLLSERLKDGEILFADPDSFNQQDDFAGNSFSLQDIVPANLPVTAVRQDKGDS